jgi:hypothetical protein
MAWKDLSFFLERSLTGYRATFKSSAFDVAGFSRLRAGVNISYMSGVDTSLWIYLDTSMDGMNWLTIYSQETFSPSAPELTSVSGGQLLRFARARIYMNEDHADPGTPQTAVLSIKGMAID